jgi:hypothetical protein
MLPFVVAYILLLQVSLISAAGRMGPGPEDSKKSPRGRDSGKGDAGEKDKGKRGPGGPPRFPVWKSPQIRKPVRKIITFKPGGAALEYSAMLEGVGGKVVKELPFVDSVVVELPPEFIEREGLQQILSYENVLAVEDDFEVDLLCFFKSSPNLTHQTVPWGVDRIKAPNAWQAGRGKGVKVGIVDTGVDVGHRDLKQNIKAAVDVTGSGGEGVDLHGHGSHVAGTIAALNNEIGVVGVAPEAEIHAVRSFDKYGRARISDIVAGVTWCVENDMQVVNMSFGSKDESTALKTAIEKGLSKGMIFVAAAGNDGRDNSVVFPARHPGVVAVSAISQDERIASFSSTGPEVDVTAPGDKILSTHKGGGYKALSGTSMATPHVTGTVAVILSANPGLTARGALAKLLEGTERLPELGRNQQGAGLVNTAQSVGIRIHEAEIAI